MSTIAYPEFDHPIREEILAAQSHAWERIANAGSWWTGAQRVEIARVVRQAHKQRSDPPWLRDQAAEAADGLSARAVEVARRVAIDAHRFDREWCQQAAVDLGDGAYVEIVSVAVFATIIDAFAEALGAESVSLPEPQPGEPDRIRPDGLGDAGAWVPMTVPWRGPNVARALSLVPADHMTFASLVAAMYAGQAFMDLVWDGPLNRPQAELVASRVAAVNECFY